MHPVRLVEIAELINLGKIPAAYVVILRERNGDRCLPVTLGAFEGLYLEHGLCGSSAPRPLMHELMVAMLRTVHCELKAVHIHGWQSIFFAVAQLRRGIEELAFECRPGDALALAALADTPVYVSETLLAQEGRPYPQEAMRWRAQMGRLQT